MKINTNRQVQLIIWTVILVWIILAILVNSLFLIMPALIWFGLIKAGITWSCPLENLLKKLPYNK